MAIPNVPFKDNANALANQAPGTHPLQLRPCVLRRPSVRLASSGSCNVRPRKSTTRGDAGRKSQLPESATQHAQPMHPCDGHKWDTETAMGAFLAMPKYYARIPSRRCVTPLMWTFCRLYQFIAGGQSAVSIAFHCVQLALLAGIARADGSPVAFQPLAPSLYVTTGCGNATTFDLAAHSRTPLWGLGGPRKGVSEGDGSVASSLPCPCCIGTVMPRSPPHTRFPPSCDPGSCPSEQAVLLKRGYPGRPLITVSASLSLRRCLRPTLATVLSAILRPCG